MNNLSSYFVQIKIVVKDLGKLREKIKAIREDGPDNFQVVAGE